MTTEEITNYIFLEDEDPSGDLAFVFGVGNGIQEGVDKAYELFKKGSVPRILLSGGENEKYHFIEADEMFGRLQQLGIPPEKMLKETRSKNSLENVLNSLPILDREFGLPNIVTIVVIAKDYHMRRAMMTLRKHLPDHIELLAAPFHNPEYGVTKATWNDQDKSRDRVLDELRRIKEYKAKGDIADLH